jgi:hypothetical protein
VSITAVLVDFAVVGKLGFGVSQALTFRAGQIAVRYQKTCDFTKVVSEIRHNSRAAGI